MSVDTETVRRVAHLARLKMGDEELERLKGDMNAILGFVEQLGEVDVEGVEPMTSVVDASLKRRDDVVTDGGYPDRVLANAPEAADGFYLVPRVVE
ncbi:Asp-tRNA(Asn)/Glu-tRNA(Gln) amidotransferase GatCAB subunit C [Acuticoccus sediminis]|uniref:Aspartyl/glutamyl-tRNA(Asn/Gln) amidotransferase subunit C n=1 Tax=Acuticoccus sediminis TaxID=2184697 RepID=A0A8B2NMR3_9HYPH|nr:Asp-tRNA(Asn)/Glu-tRNA(Gln) amidotransferase subunit GatC [Acuticoccus sediminis]RAI00976.1 Asp-tRNA(Asn)/Glu-tRNA(Gln) amidotransferase GatCAB subunit C [Acuticoccus sediminis]